MALFDVIPPSVFIIFNLGGNFGSGGGFFEIDTIAGSYGRVFDFGLDAFGCSQTIKSFMSLALKIMKS